MAVPSPAWGTERERVCGGAEALTFDTVVGTVCRCPSRAALSPADIPPVGSPKQGQHKAALPNYSQSHILVWDSIIHNIIHSIIHNVPLPIKIIPLICAVFPRHVFFEEPLGQIAGELI